MLSSRQMDTAYSVITKWPEYKPTPLIEMPDVAKACGVKSVLYKDESKRFGLQSFKALAVNIPRMKFMRNQEKLAHQRSIK